MMNAKETSVQVTYYMVKVRNVLIESCLGAVFLGVSFPLEFIIRIGKVRLVAGLLVKPYKGPLCQGKFGLGLSGSKPKKP